MRTFAVVTTFHARGLETYGQRMIDTFLKNWPKEVKLYLYPENCRPRAPSDDRVSIVDINTIKNLDDFKSRWKNIPKANGDVSSDPIRSRRKDAGKGFKWDAVRFAHKVYTIFDCAQKTDRDILLWMDADTICHSSITIERIDQLIPDGRDLCYLGRHGKFSECGLYSLDLRSIQTREFLREFQRVYDQAEKGIFLMDEWHDSFVFDRVRERFPLLKQYNWSEKLVDLRPRLGNSVGEGHPLINSDWGAYLDHLKGDDRKKLGRSKREDLKVLRNEPYWQQFK
jgi:hypothetical protein